MKLTKKETAIISKLLDLVDNMKFVTTRINDNQDCYNNAFLSAKDTVKFVQDLKGHETKYLFNNRNSIKIEVKI